MQLPRLAIKNAQFTITMVILMVLVGIVSYFTMPRSEDPQFDLPITLIDVIYPGAMLKGESIPTGEYIGINGGRAPITLSVSLENLNGKPSTIINNPRIDTVREGVKDMLQQGVTGSTAAKINFTTEEEMAQMIEVHHPNVKQDLLAQALQVFFGLRDVNGLKKKPSTSELIDWLKLLLAEDIDAQTLHDKTQKGGLMPLFGALLKNEQDVSLIEKLAFLAKR